MKRTPSTNKSTDLARRRSDTVELSADGRGTRFGGEETKTVARAYRT